MLQNGSFPDVWKEANVVPLYKGKGNKCDPNNYRPISLISCIGKLMERCVFKHVFNYLHTNNILTSVQSGFIPGDSTINQLLYLYNYICSALDAGKEIRIIFCDISKAFDRVWHKGLLFKLKQAGISGKLQDWFQNYLNNRKQRVCVDGSTSGWTIISAGVPQGSILGPLLFLVYINDIVDDLNANIRLFLCTSKLRILLKQQKL